MRYTSLIKAFPEIASELFDKGEEDAKSRYEKYREKEEYEYQTQQTDIECNQLIM